MSDDKVPGQLAVLRVVMFALVTGTLVFGGATLFTAGRMSGPPRPDAAAVCAFLGVGVVGVAVTFAFGPTLGRMYAARPSPVPGMAGRTPFQRFVAETLARAALAEVFALVLILIGYPATHDWRVLTPVPVLLAFLVRLVPTAGTYQRWRERASVGA